MSREHVLWLCIFTSVSSVSKAATDLVYEKNETNFNLQGGMKLSANITTTEPHLMSRVIRSEVQDADSFLPKQSFKWDVDVNVARKDILSSFLKRNSDVLGEVSLSFDDNSEHEVKNNSSGNAKPTNSYETALQGNNFGLTTRKRILLEHSADVDTITIRPHHFPNYYNEDEYFTENELEEGITKTEAAGEEEVTGNNESLSMSEVDRITLSELSERESYLVTYTTDSGVESTFLDGEIQDHDDVTRSSTDTTINNSTKAPYIGKATQSELDQHSAPEYEDKILTNSFKTRYTGSSTTGTETNRIKKLSSIKIREGTHRTSTSAVPAERYRTIKHTPRRGKESSRSPYQLEKDYADDYYEVWRQTRGRSTTLSTTESEEIKATDDINQRAYVPYFPEHTFTTETVNSYTSDGVTNTVVDYDSTVSEGGLMATTVTEKPPVTMQDVSDFLTGQIVKNFYTSDEVATSAYDHDSTVREEAVKAITDVTKPTVSIRHSSTSEDIRKTVKIQLSRVKEYDEVVNNNAAHRRLEENYNSITANNSGSSAVSQTPVSSYGTLRTSYRKIKKFNCSTNESECSTTSQGSTAFRKFEESTKAVRIFENGSEFDFRAQRESLRKVFKVSDDFALCEDCDAEEKDSEDDDGETSVLELPIKQKPDSDNSYVPENYDTCSEEENDKTVLKNETKITPQSQKPEGEDWNKQGAKNKSRKGDKIATKILTDDVIHRKMPGSMWKSLPKQPNRSAIIETSPSEYPWFVIINTSKNGMRCTGAMVAPRWLMTASSCVRADDKRTDAYSASVQVTVNVTGKLYQTVRAVFPSGGGVALVRLTEPPDSALFMTGRLDIADVMPPALWICCVALGMGRCEEDDRKLNKTVKHPESMFAAGTWALALEGAHGQDKASESAAPVRTPCGAEPGAPLACHRRFMDSGGVPPASSLLLEPPRNDPGELVLVGVSAGENRPGLGCRGSKYWGVATLQFWLEEAIAQANADIEGLSGSQMELPPDPYTQRLRRLRMEGSLPENGYSRGAARSGRRLLSVVAATATAAAARVLLGS